MPPLQILILTFGSTGDVHPVLPVARSLRERGHRVWFAANARFKAMVRRQGVEFIGWERGASSTAAAARRPALIGDTWAYRGLEQWRSRKRLVLENLRWLYELIEAKASGGRLVVVARGYNNFAARIAQEKLGVPLASLCLHPVMFRSEHDSPGLPVPEGPAFRLARRFLWRAIDWQADLTITPEINAFRSELGLPPIRRPWKRWIHSPECVIGLFPDWFGAPQPDWPPHTHLTHFPLFDDSGAERAPAGLEEFLTAGAAPLVFTLGSHSSGQAPFFETCVEVCRLTGRRGLLLAGATSVRSPLPETVRHFEYVPLSQVLGRAAALVHHGGIGTAALALAAGVPQLVMPRIDDQSDNARRLIRLGVGAEIAAGRFRPRPVAAKIDEMLGSDRVAQACRQTAERFAGQNPVAEICRLIEDLGAAGYPAR